MDSAYGTTKFKEFLFLLIDALEIVGLEAHVQQLRTKLHSLIENCVPPSTYRDFQKFIDSIGRTFNSYFNTVDTLDNLRRCQLSFIVPVVDITNAKDEAETVELLWSSLVEYNAGNPERYMGWPVYLRCHLFELDVGRYRERYRNMSLEILREDVEEFVRKRVGRFCSEKEPAAVSGDYRVIG
jgi:hypothetical protein